jgi:hypothetical protein
MNFKHIAMILRFRTLIIRNGNVYWSVWGIMGEAL